MFKFILPTAESIITRNFARSFSKTKLIAQQTQSNLFKLRKSTGYALSKCKEALEKHNGSVEEATKWLNEQAQKEGWSKAEKLKNRTTSQGTLVFVNDKTLHRASIIELNCETDFVARNEKFLDLSSQIALSIIKNVQSDALKKILFKEEINKLSFDANKTIGDQIALGIGSIGENMSLRRAVVFNVKPGQYLSWYMHGSSAESMNNCHFGKYGALVNLSFEKFSENYKPFDIGKQIAQHIVGMKPSFLGELMPDVNSNASSTDSLKIDESETRLLYQEFLMKPNTRVLDFLREHNATVNEYVRFETGETIDTETNVN